MKYNNSRWSSHLGKKTFSTLHYKRGLTILLAVAVLLVISYTLILPASTLTADKANEQGGVDVPQEELQVAEESDAADDEPEHKALSKKEKKEKKETVDSLAYEGEGYAVRIENADLTADTSLNVKEIREDSDKAKERKAYKRYYKDALEAVQNEKGGKDIAGFSVAKFYDISLMDGNTEVEPDSAVDVKIAFSKAQQKELKVADPERVHIVHFAVDKETGEVTPEVLDTKSTDITVENKKVTEAAFTTDSFSVFAVVYTTLEKTYISASGDTYEVTVKYDESAEIPEDAELEVREIAAGSKEYKKNVSAVNKTVSKTKGEFVDPAQFDISIVSDGEEIEPKEGSKVNVKIELAPKAFGIESFEKAKESKGKKGKKGKEEESGVIYINGEEIEITENKDAAEYAECTVAHITKDNSVELIDDVESAVENETLSVQFETESFSDYTVQPGWNGFNLNDLPSVLYVGDEIYMQNLADYWVTGIGSVVSETKYNGRDDYKSVRATNTGTFRICHKNDWNNGNPYRNYKEITILPARTEGNNGQPYLGTTPPATIETVSNASIGVKLNLFDYDLDDFLDNRFNNKDYGDAALGAFVNHGINNGHSLKFWGSGITDSSYGAQNNYVEHGVTSIVKNDLAGGYPTLKSDNTSLDYLFTPSDGTDKKAYLNADGLFKKDGDYYVYDSNQNYAWYNPSTNKFDVYNRTYKQKLRGDGGENAPHTADKAIGFFPFHEWDEQRDLFVNWNKNLNHHFGMSMSVDFSLPKSPKAVEDTNGQPIIFEFSGDDDMWVFIDGKLAMDIGGIHQPTSGTINFTEKTVTVNGNSQNFDFSKLYDGKKHTLQVFYIERGGCDSNCKIKFNMTQYGDVEFDKVDADDNSKLLAGAVFGLYKDPDCRIPLMEKLDDAHGGVSRSFTVETDENGHAKLEDVPLGDYYLKEIRAPEGYPLSVSGETARVKVYLDANGNVKASVNGTNTADKPKITNKKPSPINLGLKKEWQNENKQAISVPDSVKATFEIKRMRTYVIHTEEKIEGEERQSSHLTVGWLHKNQPYEYEEFDLVAGSQATVSWSYKAGYEGTVGCRLNGTDYIKTSNPNNIYSQGFTMPAAGQTAVIYIIDDSENGDAISGINVAGSEFYGNSGGGYIHTFHKFTEPDPDFTYSGENVTDNKVKLPIDQNTWQYMFSNLPTFGTGKVRTALEEGGEEKEYDVSFHYSYYLEEVSNTAPDGTTVIYKDLNGNEINSPTDAETSTSGTQEIINRIRTGYLKVEKKVTYNNLSTFTSQQASKLAGKYTFTLYVDEECNTPYKQNGQPVTIPITIEADGAAVSSEPIELPVGNYWLKETASTNQAMYPVGDNKLPVTITANDISSNPVIKSLTNNYDENDGPDKIVLDIEKKFSGLNSKDHVPQDFKVFLTYKLNGQDVELELKKDQLETQHDNNISWSSEGDFVWHWRISKIDPAADNFKIKEINYGNAEGYSFDWAKLDNVEITKDPPSKYHDMNVTAPTATLEEVTEDRIEPDNDKNYKVFENDVILVSLTGNHGEHGTLVVSQEALNKLERDSIQKKVPSLKGSWKNPCYFFSIQEHPEGFYYKGNRVTFTWDATRKCYIVHVEHPQSSMEEVFVVSYDGHSDLNNALYENHYEESPVSVDIVKVDQNNKTIKLGGAYFTLRQIEDAAPTPQGTYNSLVGGINAEIGPTDPTTGVVTKSGLTHGYYELTEKSSPAGYIMKDDLKVYFKIDAGKITWLEPGSGAPSTWEKKTTTDEIVTFHTATDTSNASFEVGNEPGSELPHTGGIGTTFFYVLGTILVLGCGIYYVARKRMIN